MKKRSGHFIFAENFHYNDDEELFPSLMDRFLEETGLMPDEEVYEIYLRVNMGDITRDKKPEGINRRGRFRLIFPIPEDSARKEMYIQANTKVTELKRVVQLISDMLREGGIEHELIWDKLDKAYRELKE